MIRIVQAHANGRDFLIIPRQLTAVVDTPAYPHVVFLCIALHVNNKQGKIMIVYKFCPRTLMKHPDEIHRTHTVFHFQIMIVQAGIYFKSRPLEFFYHNLFCGISAIAFAGGRRPDIYQKNPFLLFRVNRQVFTRIFYQRDTAVCCLNSKGVMFFTADYFQVFFFRAANCFIVQFQMCF